MSRFIRTLAGKTLIFILCIVLLCAAGISVLGIFLYAENDFDIYTRSEESLKEEYITGTTLNSYGGAILYAELIGNGDYDYVSDSFVYSITDENGDIIAKSEGYDDLDVTPYTLTYILVEDSSGEVTDYYYTNSDSPENSGRQYCTVSLYPVADSAAANKLSLLNTLIHIAYSLRYAIYFIAAGSLIGAIVCMVALMHAAGRRPDSEEIYPGPLSVIPFDLMLAACAAVTAGLCFIGSEMGNGGIPFVLFVILAILIIMSLILGLCMSMAGRVKRHVLLKGTLCFLILRLIWKGLRGLARLIARLHLFNRSLFRGLPLVWKTALTIAGLTILEIAVLSSFDFDAIIAVWVIEKAVLVPAALYFMLTLRRLQKSGAALAAGDLSYHTDTHGMFWDLKQHGEHLNSIASGMSIAVEDRLKSERMKTELITNVSHDIKTPLTSIINYASLIGNEPCENAVIKEYSAVLVRQSEKLKRLIEDLVEASKASTGNLEVLLSPCDASVFLLQASGEYEEKLKASELELIVKHPEYDLVIMADGRRMWRIFDNLMNNICKYAQPWTRVYLSLEESDGNAVITFKNTSREPLDMTEEELMERFTRGDSSRSTEGNGLGLSIARSMAELQGGRLNLSIDGDLFKAILTFPLA